MKTINYLVLHGIPIILKANIKTRDTMPTSCGSVLLRNYIAKQNDS